MDAEAYWEAVRATRADSTDLNPTESEWLEATDNTVDNTEWYTCLSARAGDSRAKSDSYYTPKSAAYLTYAVLFEDFEGGPNGLGLLDFVRNRVLPAQDELYKRFGTVPIIVRLPSASDNLEVDMRNLTEEAVDSIRQANEAVAL
jgi:hypothetical protein